LRVSVRVVAPSRVTVCWIVKQLEGTGTACDKFAQRLKHSASVGTEGVVGATREAVTMSCGNFQRNGFGVKNNDLQVHHPGLLQANDELFVLSFQVRLQLNFQMCGAPLYPS
jgi:hypothetical protein